MKFEETLVVGLLFVALWMCKVALVVLILMEVVFERRRL